ncbi:hypothetical protein HNQ57_003581 [Zhongshania antarctica]|uniref:site-specific DNA-methyltransferase (adenine-specific) n=1 Tax=Zhongshania antarctica TaxID=641702 RepID=A0A840R9S5_9GAMM|nr:class I SAM-dependent DNA methyltransferase [Zhongshania antarctica]MBB5189278.1 hypothetical protein [Zhongshania antarctica]
MPLSWNEIRDRSVTFVREWENESSEHAEAKTFWDEFFQVFGVSRRRLAAFEKHVKKSDGKDGFIDLFWPGMLLAEHKSRGKNLDSAYDQAVDYFPGLSDKELPRYIIVSDFARFRVRNLDSGESVEFPLAELSKNLSTFSFIAGYETRQYKEQDPVNTKAAEKLAQLHDTLKDIGYEGHELEVYLVRILFCMFADDTGIFMPRSAFEDFIRVRTAEDGSDLAPRLNQIFQTLNTPPEKRLKNLDDQIAAFPYVNGKLFSEFLPQASFDRSMRETLLDCCELDWGAISPAIFGSLFQGIMDADMRRNLGAHYTSEKNILKVIGPLFMDELREEFDKVKTQVKKLQDFHEKLGSLNFFDPACGCGNFLVISYREIRLLELEVIKRLYSKDQQQLSMDAVNQYVKIDVDQFHGIEIEEWPAQIARVAMWLIDHQMNLLVGEAFGQALVRVPLVKSANVVHGNALRLDWNAVIPSDKCSYMFGNPPFIGKSNQTTGQKLDLETVFNKSKGAKDLDLVTAWYAKAAIYSSLTTKCGFVSTNSITQGQQVSILWSFLNQYGIKILFAHRTFRWSNEAKGVAAVHCVILGFGKKEEKSPKLYEYDNIGGEPHLTIAKEINPYLVDAPSILLPSRLTPLCPSPPMLYGNKPADGGYLLLTNEEKDTVLDKEPHTSQWIKPFVGAQDFLNAGKRWCLWLANAPPNTLKSSQELSKRVKGVKEFREKSTKKQTVELAKIPTLFAEIRQSESDYVLIPRHSSVNRSYIPFGFFSKEIIVGDSCFALPNANLFQYGVIQSAMHMAWTRSVCGRIKSDYRYSASIVYNNFPWPINAAEKHIKAIEISAQGILDARDIYPDSSLADLYNPLTMPPNLVKAHQTLDRAVDAAYVPSGGKKSWDTEAERVAFLFELYQKITSLLPVEKKKSKARKKAAV